MVAVESARVLEALRVERHWGHHSPVFGVCCLSHALFDLLHPNDFFKVEVLIKDLALRSGVDLPALLDLGPRSGVRVVHEVRVLVGDEHRHHRHDRVEVHAVVLVASTVVGVKLGAFAPALLTVAEVGTFLRSYVFERALLF